MGTWCSQVGDKPHSICQLRERGDVLLLNQQLWWNHSPQENFAHYNLTINSHLHPVCKVWPSLTGNGIFYFIDCLSEPRERIFHQSVTKAGMTRVTHVHTWAVLALEIILYRNYLIGFYWSCIGRTENPVKGHIAVQDTLKSAVPSAVWFALSFFQIHQTSAPSPSEFHCKLISSHWKS